MGGNGPVRFPPVAKLARVGLGGRVLKTALAAGLAWEAGSRIPDAPTPYLAPLTALLVMQITIVDSISTATQRFVGVLLGVAVALAVSSAFGVNGPSVALLVLVGLVLGALLRLGPQAIPQVAISALLIVAVDSAPTLGLAYARIVETIVGAAIGIAINALLAPPSHLPAARSAVDAHAAALAGALDRLAAGVRGGITGAEADAILAEARATDALYRAAQAAVARTEGALRFNLWRRRERPETARLALALRTLERVAIQARGIVRTIDDAVAQETGASPSWLAPETLGGALGSAIAGVAALVRAFPAAVIAEDGQGGGGFANLANEAGRARSAVAVSDEAAGICRTADDWIRLGSVLADLDRIRRELSGAVGPTPVGAGLPPATAPRD